MNAMPICFALNKPFGVLSQFTSEGGHPGLGSLGLELPTDVYPVGRLDRDSEGLLLLSNDSKLIHELLEPRHGHPRTYHVQVEGSVTEEHIESLVELHGLNQGFNVFFGDTALYFDVIRSRMTLTWLKQLMY